MNYVHHHRSNQFYYRNEIIGHLDTNYHLLSHICQNLEHYMRRVRLLNDSEWIHKRFGFWVYIWILMELHELIQISEHKAVGVLVNYSWIVYTVYSGTVCTIDDAYHKQCSMNTSPHSQASPVFFCSSVCVQYIIHRQKWKNSEKRGRPGLIHHVSGCKVGRGQYLNMYKLNSKASSSREWMRGGCRGEGGADI